MSGSGPRSNPVRRVLGKGRRGLRRLLLGQVTGTADHDRVEELWHWVNGMQQTVNQIAAGHQLVNEEAARSGEHLDLVVDQLWRRLEAADARLATQVQRLQADTGRQLADLSILAGRLRKENAAILRLIGHPEAIEEGADQAPDVSLPVERMTLFAEVEGGNADERLARLRQYVPYFAGLDGPVVDLGCGEGEFLSLLQDAGVSAWGVDLEADAVERGKAAGRDVRYGNLFAVLEEVPDGSLAGAFSSQVVEHLPPETIAPLYELLYRKLGAGAPVVVETPNPATFATHVQSFWRDPTHIRPVPMPALDFAARSAGFISEQTIYTSPTPVDEKLQRIQLEPQDPMLAELVDRFNTNVAKLDDLLYGWQDYALVSRKP